jgi:predicted alpha/beta hydrolase family esterase
MDAKLAASLGKELGPKFHVRYPMMPNEASPDDQTWKKALARELAATGEGAIVVAHSVGAAVVIRFIAESEPTPMLAGVFLIAAPFLGDGGWPSEDGETSKSMAAKLKTDVPLYLYHGRDDEVVPFAHVDLYANALPRAVIGRLDGCNHQLNEDLSPVARDIEQLARGRKR